MAGKITVLVVDDDPTIRMLCRINLELDGYAVLEAGSLGDARQLAEVADVVLLDVHVGGGDGLAFVAEVREVGAGVALLTGSAELGPDHGADAVIGKPFTIDELRETVERLGSGG